MSAPLRRQVKLPLTERELEEIAQKMFEPESDDDDNVIEDNTDLSDEDIIVDNYESSSEQSASEGELEEENSADNKFFTGKDGATKWRKMSYGTKKSNIVKTGAGVNQCAKDINNELEAFLKIVDLDMLDEIINCTNMYIDNLRQQHEYARERDCRNTTRSEFMAYLGLLYVIGIKKSHHENVKEIWNKDGTGIEIARAVMSYKRFLFLTRSLRFDDEASRTQRRSVDKLTAIRTFLEAFVRNSKACYSLSAYSTIDEMFHPFRGRCSWIQYMPRKPAKYGIKMYALCDAKTLYTSSLEIYCGTQPEGPYATSNLPMDVVKRLVVPIEHCNKNLTTDNYFTSIPLADYLLEKKITLIGTLNKNKMEVPAEFQPHKQKEVSSTLFGFQKDKMLTSYVPCKNKAVILLSTLHHTGEIDPTTKKPQVLMDYNATKGAIDTVDKMCAAYSVSRITKRWPCVIFYSLLNIAGINAQVLYSFAKASSGSKYRRIFLKNLGLSLMKEHLVSRSKLLNLPSDVSAFLHQNYGQPAEDMDEEQPRPKRGACRLCVIERKRSSATMKCNSCNAFTCKRHSKIEIFCIQCQIKTDSSLS